MRGSHRWTSTIFAGLMALAVPAGLVWANHVRILLHGEPLWHLLAARGGRS